MKPASENPLGRRKGIYAGELKRGFDVLVAASSIVLLTPVWLPLALMVRVFMGSPVVFRQVRTGKGGRPFTLFKFRTMTSARGPDEALLPDEQRLNRFGRILRSSSLDELPELLNVLKGEMSLVGPRPFLPQYDPLYTPAQARRQEVPPGITGWAQINGRHQIPFSKRIELDVWYVDHVSFWLDLRILARTIPSALASRGVHVTERDEDIVDIGPGEG